MSSEEVLISRNASVTITVTITDEYPRPDATEQPDARQSLWGNGRELLEHRVSYPLPESALEFRRNIGESRWKRQVLDGDALEIIEQAFDDAKAAAVAQVTGALAARGKMIPPPRT